MSDPVKRLLGVCLAALVLGALAATGLFVADGGSRVSAHGLAALTARQATSASDAVTAADIADARGTAAGALLRWWSDVQNNSGSTQVDTFYAPDAGVTASSIHRDLLLASYLFRITKPVVVDVATGAQRADVFTLILHGRLNAASVKRTVTPYVFRFVRVSGRWVLADNNYLAAKASFISHANGGP
jgi:hypothetical protein